VIKNPPGQVNILGRKPWPKLSFPLDTYRQLYYQDYPDEAMLYAHSALPGDAKYRKSPMEMFLDRHFELTTEGLDPDLAYLQCQEEKDAREFASHLERFFCAQQAALFYGVEHPLDAPEDRKVPSAYEKARNYVMKQRRDQLASLIRMKKDIGPHAKVTREDVDGISEEELYEYIHLHPEDRDTFDESVFAGDDYVNPEDEMNQLVSPQSVDSANDPLIAAHFGIGSYWLPSKYQQLDIKRATNQDLENIQQDTLKMLDHMAEELGLDSQSESLFDSLSDAGRFEVIQTWSANMPDSKELLNDRFYTSRMSRHMAEYDREITRPAQEQTPSYDQSLDSSFMDSHINQPFHEYSDNVSKVRTERAKRTDPLKAAASKIRSSSSRL
jgi:hypothetical protein